MFELFLPIMLLTLFCSFEPFPNVPESIPQGHLVLVKFSKTKCKYILCKLTHLKCITVDYLVNVFTQLHIQSIFKVAVSVILRRHLLVIRDNNVYNWKIEIQSIWMMEPVSVHITEHNPINKLTFIKVRGVFLWCHLYMTGFQMKLWWACFYTKNKENSCSHCLNKGMLYV